MGRVPTAPSRMRGHMVGEEAGSAVCRMLGSALPQFCEFICV